MADRGEVQVVEVDRFPAEPFQCPVESRGELSTGNSGGAAERTCWPPRQAGQPAGSLHPRLAPSGRRYRSVKKTHPHCRLPPLRGLVQAGLAQLARTPSVCANAERRHTHTGPSQQPLGSSHCLSRLSRGRPGPVGRVGRGPRHGLGRPDEGWRLEDRRTRPRPETLENAYRTAWL